MTITQERPMYDSSQIEILTDLGQWDFPRKLMTRDGAFHVHDDISDWFVYRCPIRDRFSIAVISREGIYWTFPDWMVGGQMAGGPSRDKMVLISEPLDGDARGLSLQAGDFLRDLTKTYPNDPCLGQRELLVPVSSLCYNATPDSRFKVDRVAVYQFFDEKFGAGSFKASVRSARMRHMRRRHLRDSMNRAQMVCPD